MGVGDQRQAPASLPPGSTHVPISQEVGWAPAPVWTGAEILLPTLIDSQTVRSVTSPYTDYSVPNHVLSLHHLLSLPTSCFPTGFPMENSECLPLSHISPSCDTHTFHGNN